jgi:hypothetical protein
MAGLSVLLDTEVGTVLPAHTAQATEQFLTSISFHICRSERQSERSHGDRSIARPRACPRLLRLLHFRREVVAFRIEGRHRRTQAADRTMALPGDRIGSDRCSSESLKHFTEV